MTKAGINAIAVKSFCLKSSQLDSKTGFPVRHYLFFALSIAPLAFGILVFAVGGLCVLAVGSSEAVASGFPRAEGRAILVPTITEATDQRLSTAADTLEKSGGSTHQQKG